MPAEGARKFAMVVERAWRDPVFKARLLAEPHVALALLGLEVPSGMTVKVVENTETVVHLVLPAKPAEGELSEEALEAVAGGTGSMFASWGGSGGR